MPYVTVLFDPRQVSQEIIDTLKPWLQKEVAGVLSAIETLADGYLGYDVRDIRTRSEEIMVVQHATHPTDVNVPPLEIYIQAGRPKGRNSDQVVKLLGEAVSESKIVPNGLLGDGEAGIFVTFHEHNGFGFIPKFHLTAERS